LPTQQLELTRLDGRDVDLDDVRERHKGTRPVVDLDQVVQRDGEAACLEGLHARQDFRIAGHRLQDLQHDLVARQQFDHVGQQEHPTDVDESQVLAERLLETEVAEQLHDDRGTRDGVVHHVRVGLVAVSKQQFEGEQFLLAIENGLPPEKHVLFRSHPVSPV
jgi:hypothetical protein